MRDITERNTVLDHETLNSVTPLLSVGLRIFPNNTTTDFNLVSESVLSMSSAHVASCMALRHYNVSYIYDILIVFYKGGCRGGFVVKIFYSELYLFTKYRNVMEIR